MVCVCVFLKPQGLAVAIPPTTHTQGDDIFKMAEK